MPPRSIIRRRTTTTRDRSLSAAGAAWARPVWGYPGRLISSRSSALCDNLDPHTGEQLTVRTRAERTVGYDFTFSVPKSVSLLYALSGDQDILGAFRT